MLVGRPTLRSCDSVDVYPEVRGLQWLLLFYLVKPSTLYSLWKKIVAVRIAFKTRDTGQAALPPCSRIEPLACSSTAVKMLYLQEKSECCGLFSTAMIYPPLIGGQGAQPRAICTHFNSESPSKSYYLPIVPHWRTASESVP